jgi:hypothetical protein
MSLLSIFGKPSNPNPAPVAKRPPQEVIVPRVVERSFSRAAAGRIQPQPQPGNIPANGPIVKRQTSSPNNNAVTRTVAAYEPDPTRQLDEQLTESFHGKTWQVYQARWHQLSPHLNDQRHPFFSLGPNQGMAQPIKILRNLPQDFERVMPDQWAYLVALIQVEPDPSFGTGGPANPISLVTRYDRKGLLPSSGQAVAHPWSKTGTFADLVCPLIVTAHIHNVSIRIANPNLNLYTMGCIVGLVVTIQENGQSCQVQAVCYPDGSHVTVGFENDSDDAIPSNNNPVTNFASKSLVVHVPTDKPLSNVTTLLSKIHPSDAEIFIYGTMPFKQGGNASTLLDTRMRAKSVLDETRILASRVLGHGRKIHIAANANHYPNNPILPRVPFHPVQLAVEARQEIHNNISLKHFPCAFMSQANPKVALLFWDANMLESMMQLYGTGKLVGAQHKPAETTLDVNSCIRLLLKCGHLLPHAPALIPSFALSDYEDPLVISNACINAQEIICIVFHTTLGPFHGREIPPQFGKRISSNKSIRILHLDIHAQDCFVRIPLPNG